MSKKLEALVRASCALHVAIMDLHMEEMYRKQESVDASEPSREAEKIHAPSQGCVLSAREHPCMWHKDKDDDSACSAVTKGNGLEGSHCPWNTNMSADEIDVEDCNRFTSRATGKRGRYNTTDTPATTADVKEAVEPLCEEPDPVGCTESDRPEAGTVERAIWEAAWRSAADDCWVTLFGSREATGRDIPFDDILAIVDKSQFLELDPDYPNLVRRKAPDTETEA